MLSRILLLMLLSAVQVSYCAAQSPCMPVAPRCEYLTNPVGIDARNPRLSWQLEDHRTAAKQTAYQWSIGTDSTEVCNRNGNQCQTGQLNEAAQLLVFHGYL